MKSFFTIWCFIGFFLGKPTTANGQFAPHFSFEFYGDSLQIPIRLQATAKLSDNITSTIIHQFYDSLNAQSLQKLAENLLRYKAEHKLDDWLYYQLIRKTAECISPKKEQYNRYTLYKWYLLKTSGYDATLKLYNNKLLLYIQSDENIYEIPYYAYNGKQYVCLNYHDYPGLDIQQVKFSIVNLPIPEGGNPFSYKINQLPSFQKSKYTEKLVQFEYGNAQYQFNLKVNPEIQQIFANYPIVDYEANFNIPLSKELYQSLIPILKKNTADLTTEKGVEYLMRFTRYAFLFKSDTEQFGKEKRLTPEQTLIYGESDCEDRAALFYYLVKELYNLPMLVLSYPEHVTIAVKFDKAIGRPLLYKGEAYSICEPTPQKRDLKIGQMIPALRDVPYEVVCTYTPVFQK